MVRKTKRYAAGVVAVLTGASLAGTSGVAFADGHWRDGGHVKLDRAFVIMLENHSQQGVIGDTNAPYITSLANTYGNATQYYKTVPQAVTDRASLGHKQFRIMGTVDNDVRQVAGQTGPLRGLLIDLLRIKQEPPRRECVASPAAHWWRLGE